MKLLAKLKHIGRLFPALPAHSAEQERNRVRRIVCRFAQGNIYLQLGRYISESDIKKRKADLATYDFMP